MGIFGGLGATGPALAGAGKSILIFLVFIVCLVVSGVIGFFLYQKNLKKKVFKHKIVVKRILYLCDQFLV